MSDVKKFAKYSAVVTLILILTKFVGYIRELLIAVKFGATRESDIFKIATTAPLLIFSCVAAALITSFIPVFSDIKNDKEKANKFFNNIVNIIGLLCIIFSVVGIVFAPLMVKSLAGGFNNEDFNRAVYLTRILMPSIIFLAISGLFTGYLQSYGIFIQPALTDICSNIVVIAGIILFYKYGILAAVIATLCGALTQALVQKPFLKGYKYKFHIDFKDENALKMLKLAIPTIVSTAVSQINLMFSRNSASRLMAGSISIIDYSSKLSTIINQVFITSITTVLYPKLTEKYAQGDVEGFKNMVVKCINMILIIVMPLILGIIVLSVPLVKILLEHGKFDHSSTYITANCLRILAVSTLGYSMIDILSKVFFATKNTFTPMINGFAAVGLNVMLIAILAPKFGVVGLAYATAISTIIMSLVMFTELKIKLKDIKFYKVVITFIKTSISAIIMAFIVSFVYNKLSVVLGLGNKGLIIGLVVSTIIGMIVYFILMLIIRIEEFSMVRELVIQKIKK